MVEYEDSDIHMRISSTLKRDAIASVRKNGFESLSAYFRACAELIAYGKYSGTLGKVPEKIGDQRPIYFEPEVQIHFFDLMNRRFSAVVARTTPKKMHMLAEDVSTAYYEEYHLALLPLEITALLKQYYSGQYCTDEVRIAFEHHMQKIGKFDKQKELEESHTPDPEVHRV